MRSGRSTGASERLVESGYAYLATAVESCSSLFLLFQPAAFRLLKSRFLAFDHGCRVLR